MNIKAHQLQILTFNIMCLFIGGILVACSGSESTPAPSSTPQLAITNTPSPQPTSSSTHTITPSATATLTLSPEPTRTATQTPTQTPSSTPSPTPQIVSIINDQVVIYSGPGEAYDLLAIFANSMKIYSVGRSEDENWLIVVLPDRQGWIEARNVSADFSHDILPIVEIPPTPLPSLTPTPSPKIIYFLEKEVNLKDLHNFQLENFQPYENILIEVVTADSGEVVWFRSGSVNMRGLLKYSAGFRNKTQFPAGEYYFRVTGDQGSYAEVSFSINNPD